MAFVPHHPAWQPGAGTDCRRRRRGPSVRDRGRTDESIARSIHSAWPLHSPEGALTSRRLRTWHQSLLSRQPVRGEGLPPEQAALALKPLTCALAPLAGLEPATYGLEVRHDPSAWYHPGASPQVGSGLSSNRSPPDRLRDNNRIAKRIATRPYGLAVRWPVAPRSIRRRASVDEIGAEREITRSSAKDAERDGMINPPTRMCRIVAVGREGVGA